MFPSRGHLNKYMLMVVAVTSALRPTRTPAKP